MLFVVGCLFSTGNVNAQGSRRAEPNVLSTGYYAVDSDDDAPTPWRPNYFFVDTAFQPFTWTRIASGPQQAGVNLDVKKYFYRPDQAIGPSMDTTDNALAGPMHMGLKLPFAFYNVNYDSVTISTNGFIGFLSATGGGANPGYAKFPAANSPLPMYAYNNNTMGGFRTGLANNPKAIIAAMYADLDLRPNKDSSKVYIRTNPGADSFFVSFYNIRILPSSPYNSIEPGTGRDRLFISKMQIVLTLVDSSIQINYGPFNGTILGFPPVQAWRIFQRNSSLGVINASQTQGTSVLYRNGWDAVNTNCRSCNKNFRQQGQWALKYKQWKNIVRAIAVNFPTRNYEICLGQSVKPVATYQNVDIVTQTFKVKFQIRNVVTGIAVYGRVDVLNNVLPGQQRIDSNFASYITSPNILSQLGTFRACAIATSYDANDVFLGDRWPFDDTVCLRIYGIRTTKLPFNESSNGYSLTSVGEIPDQAKWVSIGAQVVDGESATFDPPPPRDDIATGQGIGPSSMRSPVIKFDRVDIDGNTYAGTNLGDTLVSFPFDISTKTKAAIAFAYMRTGRTTFPWLWDQQTLVGPENTVLNANGTVARAGDSMVLEFKKPAEPACNPSKNGWTEILAIDGGSDFEFKKVSTRLDKFMPKTNYFNERFRFRLRLAANDNGPLPPPDDDGDEWFVDNISLQVPLKPEIEVMWVRVVTPYTKMPASQAVSLPIAVHIANNSTDVAIAFPIRVQILDPGSNTVYWAIQTVTNLRGGTDSTIFMPNWNAQIAGSPGQFTVHAWLAQNGYDSYTEDNGTYTLFFLDINPPTSPDPQEFAYDDNSNDWPGLTQVTGQGIGFNNNSGSFAMKFRLMAKDTIYGARVYFANANQSPDAIRVSLLKGSTSCAPAGDTVGGGILEDVRRGQLFNQWWPYYFDQPIVVAGGKNSPTQGYYWLSIGQLSLDNMMMGADISRGGGRIVVGDPVTPVIPPVYNDPLGTLLSSFNSTGDVSCAWAIEQTASSGSWGLWTPSSGFWPMNSNQGTAASWRLFWATNVNCPRVIQTFIAAPPFFVYVYIFNQAGGYTPMIRAMVSKSSLLPVDLLTFKGREDNGKALLTWQTAQEKNNQGFYIERRSNENKDGFFQKVGFVQGKGTTSTASGYSYTDRNVTPGTYQYRLIQLDLDGAEKVSNQVEVGIGSPSNYSLDQNFPNPFEPSATTTDISYTLPIGSETKLLVYNDLGQIIRTLVNGYEAIGTHKISFNGKDDAGSELASGNYFYKLSSGSFSEMKKLTITK